MGVFHKINTNITQHFQISAFQEVTTKYFDEYFADHTFEQMCA